MTSFPSSVTLLPLGGMVDAVGFNLKEEGTERVWRENRADCREDAFQRVEIQVCGSPSFSFSPRSIDSTSPREEGKRTT